MFKRRSLSLSVIPTLFSLGAALFSPKCQGAPPQLTPSGFTPKISQLLDGDIESWRARATKWYDSDDSRDRRRQMKQMSRPLKQPCYYCHTRRFKDYVEEVYMISLQMMAISAEQSVGCEDCHLGKRGLTSAGAISLIQWRYAADKGISCDKCHLPEQRFKKLTSYGESSRPTLISWISKHKSQLKIPASVVDQFVRRLQRSIEIKKVKETTRPPEGVKKSPKPITESTLH